MGRVAAANGISVRGLTALFAPDDSPAAFLRRERLRRARSDLADPRWISTPVSTIGARWGFLDASTFGRAFRREFGSSPAGYRAEASGPV
ncbi:MAG: helix-turn-helix domain-containing protein [Rhodococcus sp. (in: high G+C Gram-positive bacteria)]|uniref:helix-turn-helix domain-containing protein n=1 Tax=Rhodococcus sp. TaxID=1831 RepID=UPI003BB6952E